MKNTHLFSILLCMTSMFFLQSCDSAEIQRSTAKEDPLIEPRNIDDCEDCPVDDCCCAVAILEGSMIDIDLCGTSTPNKPTTPCSQTIGSCNISGFIFTLPTLSMSNPVEYFCMPVNGTSYLRSSQSGKVRVTCQAGQVGYQSVDVDLPATRGLTVSGTCVLGGC